MDLRTLVDCTGHFWSTLAGPVRDQPTQPPHRAKSARWGPRRVPGEKPLSRLTPPRPSGGAPNAAAALGCLGGAPNAAAALGCLGRPFAVTRMGHSRNDRYSPLAAADD